MPNPLFRTNNNTMPIQRIQADYHKMEQKPGFLSKVFRSKTVGAVDNIKKLLDTPTLTAKDALLTKSVLEYEIKKNPKDATLKELDKTLNTHLLMADLDMWSPRSWSCKSDMRLEPPKGRAYQSAVQGQIDRDLKRGGIIIIGDKLFESKGKTDEGKKQYSQLPR